MKRIMILCAVLIAASLSAQERTDMKEAERIATAALPTLSGIAGKLPAAMGLTAEEAANARLAPPLQVFWVGLDALKNYQAGTNPRTLLQDVHTIFYPVTVAANVRSSITLKQRASQWVATDFGQPELAKRVSAARGTGGGILIRVPALNVWFVGTTSGSTLMLTPIADVSGTDIRANVAAPAEAVFAALAARARLMNDLPT